MRVYWCDLQPYLDRPEPFLRWCGRQGVRLEEYLRLDDALRHLAGLRLRSMAAEREGPGSPANVSHSGGLAVCVCGRPAAGIDTEEIVPAPALPTEFLTGEERRWLRAQARPERAFFQLWTRKESLVKARRGTLAELPALPALVEGDALRDVVDGLRLLELPILPERYVTTLCRPGEGAVELARLPVEALFPDGPGAG